MALALKAAFAIALKINGWAGDKKGKKMAKSEALRRFEDFFSAMEENDALALEEALERHPEWAKEANLSGDTALMMAAWHGHAECVRLLIPFSDVNDQNTNNGDTALINAALEGHVECLKALLPFADAKIANHDKQTALMDAVGQGKVDCARELIPFSDLDAVNGAGHTALERAIYGGEWECAQMVAQSMPPGWVRHLLSQPEHRGSARCKALIEHSELAHAVKEAKAAMENGKSLLAGNEAPIRPATARRV